MADTVSRQRGNERSWVLALGLLLASGVAAAQPPAIAPHAVPGPDQGFMRQAMELNAAEIELGTIAVQRAANDNVRSFAEQMIDAHRKNKDALGALAAKKGVPAPTELDRRHQALRARLSQQTGIAFDRDYMKAMVNDHQKAVNVFQREANQGKDKETRDLAKDQLAGLQSHLKAARDINRRLQIGKTGSG